MKNTRNGIIFVGGCVAYANAKIYKCDRIENESLRYDTIQDNAVIVIAG